MDMEAEYMQNLPANLSSVLCDTMPELRNYSFLCPELNGSTDAPTTALPIPIAKPLMFIDVFWALIATIVCVVTVAGNVLVIVSFFLESNLRVPSNYFICSLAVSDFLIGLFSAPLYTMYLLLGYWPLGEVICDLWLSLDYTVCLTSQYTVFFITLDRYLSVTIPAKYRSWRSHEKVSVMVAVTWILPTLIFFTVIIGWPFFVGKRTVPSDQCWAQFTENAIFSCLLAIGYYWITLVVMCFLYAGIYRVALRLQKKSEAKRKKAAKLVSVAGAEMSRIGVSFAQQGSNMRLTEESLLAANNVALPPVSEQPIPNENDSSPHKQSRYTSDSSTASTKEELSPQKEKLVECETSFIQRSPKPVRGDDDGGVYVGPSVLKPTPLPPVRNELQYLQPTPEQPPPVVHKKSNGVSRSPERNVPQEISDYFLCYPADRIHGMRFVDQESMISSIASTENIRLLSDLHRYSTRKEEATETKEESPVWKRRVPGLETVEENSILVADEQTNADPPPPKYETVVPNGPGPSKFSILKSISNDRPTISALKTSLEIRSLQIREAIHHRLVRRREASQKMSKGENRARKALRTITFILGLFVLCWTPYHVAVVVMGFCGDCINLTFYSITYWFCYLNSPVNPLCYAFVNVLFKKTFIRLLKGNCRRK